MKEFWCVRHERREFNLMLHSNSNRGYKQLVFGNMYMESRNDISNRLFNLITAAAASMKLVTSNVHTHIAESVSITSDTVKKRCDSHKHIDKEFFLYRELYTRSA